MDQREKLMAKLRRALGPADWQKHMKRLEILAAPKPKPKAKPSGKRKKWRPVSQKNIDALAQPVVKDLPDIRDPFKVQPSALTYKISARMNEIAFRKNPPEMIPPRVPGAVSPAAMKAVASPRTIILAKPMVRPPGVETDLKEDAFAVSPAALKAKCPKRIEELAQPKTYGKS